MATFGVWNNKGGTGKTSLAFQIICAYANANPANSVLVIDLCPQANLSELFLGGLTGNGGENLTRMYTAPTRRTVGGYFQERFSSPFAMPDNIDVESYLTKPSNNNRFIPPNINLLAGDPIVEIQTNAIATLANTQLPSQNTWLSVIDWIKDFIGACGTYSHIFVDLNPSFSIYTQIGLSVCDNLIVPVMADDSSRRALMNVLSLVYGVSTSAMYTAYSFATKMKESSRALPQIKMILNNRLTQYITSASAYRTVLNNINRTVKEVATTSPDYFCDGASFNRFYDIRDFGTTGVIAFAQGMPFYRLNPGKHDVLGKETQINQEYIQLCKDAIEQILVEF